MRRRHGVFGWITLCMLALGYATMTMAQVNTATLSGTVMDPQGLGVKGAKLTITNAGTGAERTAVSDDSGRYKVVGLPPGTYTLTVWHEKYGPKEMPVTVAAKDSKTVDFSYDGK